MTARHDTAQLGPGPVRARFGLVWLKGMDLDEPGMTNPYKIMHLDGQGMTNQYKIMHLDGQGMTNPNKCAGVAIHPTVSGKIQLFLEI